MKEYVITHLHTMNSNSILADSPSKLEDYLKEIKNKDGIRGIIRTEHGHCQNWFKTYQLMEKYNEFLFHKNLTKNKGYFGKVHTENRHKKTTPVTMWFSKLANIG